MKRKYEGEKGKRDKEDTTGVVLPLLPIDSILVEEAEHRGKLLSARYGEGCKYLLRDLIVLHRLSKFYHLSIK